MTSQPSPLGRYDDGSGFDPQLHEVRLIDVPVRLLVAGRQHHDDLMREFTVLAVSQQAQRPDVPQRLLDLVQVLGSRYGSAASRPDADVDQALGEGKETVDLTYQVPAHVVEAADRLEALMAEADEFCRSEQMLALPRTELSARFAHWYLDEFRRQISGEPPQPWSGPLDPDSAAQQ
jgi:hypothetical protein